MKKILVWLSWGVDSAVAAYQLIQQGYEVTAGFMKNYVAPTGNCSTYEDAEEAIKVADFLQIPLIAFDLQKEYKEKIIDYIFDGYQKWITPNPDVLCNSLIKFDVFLQKALELWFDGIATGHYARIETVESPKVKSKKSEKWLKRLYEPERPYRLLRGKDYNKDQSYFLSWLNQFQLSKSIFPLGDFTKPEIRAMAEQIWLPNAKRKDSQGLCFIGNIPIKAFLEQKLPKKEGKIINHEGKIIGKHDGARFFTLGQRRGLNLLPNHYVTKIDVKRNEIIVGPRSDEALNIKEVQLEDWHWIGEPSTKSITIIAKIRYRQEPQPAELIVQGTSAKIIFNEKQRSVTPGQVAVAYLWEECLGSWIIQ